MLAVLLLLLLLLLLLQDDTEDETYNIMTASDVSEVALNGAFVLTATVRKMPANIAAVGVEVDFNEVRLH
jgi:hypothetical protein